MEQTSPASRRRAELLASLSPEGRATYEVLRAQLARDVDRSFAESKTRLEKAVETAFGDLHTKLDRTIGDLRWKVRSDDGHRSAPAAAASASSTTRSAAFPPVPRGTVSTIRSTRTSAATSTPPRVPVQVPRDSTSSSVPATPASTSISCSAVIADPTETYAPDDSLDSTATVSSAARSFPSATSASRAVASVRAATDTCVPTAAPSDSTSTQADLTLEVSVALDGVFPTAPSPTMGTTVQLLHVLEQVKKLPATCSTNCASNNLGTTSPVSSTHQGTATRLLPPTTLAFTQELAVQAGLSPSTYSSNSVHEDAIGTDDNYTMEVFMETDGMFLTTPAASESSIFQSLQVFDDRGFHTPMPIMCLTIGTYSLLLLLPPVALDTIDTTMTERQYIYENSGNFVQKVYISLMQHVTGVRGFPSSQAHQFLSCQVTEIAATLVCFPPLPWDEKQIWPPPFSLNVLAFNLQVYEQQNKCRLLNLSGYPLIEQSNISKDIIHVHAAVDGDALVVTLSFGDHQTLGIPRRMGVMIPGVLMHIILGGFELLHWKMAWSFNWGCFKNASLVLQHFESVELKIPWLLVLQILVNGSLLQLSSSRSAPCFLMEKFSECGSQQKCEWKVMPYCTSVAIDQVLVVWPPPVQMSMHDSLPVTFLLYHMNAETGCYDCALLDVGQAPNLLQFEQLLLMRSISCLCCWNSRVHMVYLFDSEFFQWEIAWALDWGCSASGNEPSFELQQWRIVWFFSHAFLQSGFQFCSLGNDSIIDPGNSSTDLTCTRCVCVKESHNGSPADNQSNLFLAEVTAAVHIINYQLLLLVKTYGFGVRLARGRAKILVGMIVSDQAHYCQDYSVRNNHYLKIMAECSAIKMIHGPIEVAACCMLGTRFRSTHTYLSELHKTYGFGMNSARWCAEIQDCLGAQCCTQDLLLPWDPGVNLHLVGIESFRDK